MRIRRARPKRSAECQEFCEAWNLQQARSWIEYDDRAVDASVHGDGLSAEFDGRIADSVRARVEEYGQFVWGDDAPSLYEMATQAAVSAYDTDPPG